MEALAALGLACNIMQIISFGHETVFACQQISRTGSSDANLAERSTALIHLSERLSTHLNKEQITPGSLEEKLLILSQKCRDVATEIHHLIGSISLPRNSRRLPAILGIAIKTALRNKRLQRLDRALATYEKTMQTSILVCLVEKNNLSEVQQKEGFEIQDAVFKHFVQQLASGHTSLSNLMIQHSEQLKTHITQEALQTAQSVMANVRLQLATDERSPKGRITTTTAGFNDSMSGSLERRDMETVDNVRREHLLNSLKFPHMNARKNQIKDNLEKTFLWIFKHSRDNNFHRLPSWDNFAEWLKSDQKHYWISGKPGSGKSTLMKFIVSHGETQQFLEMWHEGTKILSHFFWSPGHIMQRNLKGLLCSLLHQVLEADFNVDILDTYQDMWTKDSESDWSINELQKLALVLLGRSHKPYCIFLDGLDEICPEEGVEAVITLVQDLQEIPQVKVCVASRPEPAIQRRLCRYPTLRIQDLTADDLRRCAKSILLQSPRQSKMDSRHLIDKLLEKSQGVFLWVVLVSRTLRRGLENGDTWHQLWDRLELLPTDLEKLYRDMWLRMNEDVAVYRQTAALYFRLLLASTEIPHHKVKLHENISVLELAAAANQNIQSKFTSEMNSISSVNMIEICESAISDIQIRCAGLLEITTVPKRQKKEKNVLRFVPRDEPPWIPDEEGPVASDIGFSERELSNNELSDNELSDNQLSDNQLSDNQLSDNEHSDNSLSNELSDNRLSNELSDNGLSIELSSELSDNDLSDSEFSDGEVSDDDNQCDNPLSRSGIPKTDQRYDLDRYNYLTVSFIHRTAHNFLIDTVAGHEVLASGPCLGDAISRLFKACLLRCSVFPLRIYGDYPHRHGNIVNDVNDFIMLISTSKANLNEETAAQLLSLCQEWYTADKLVSVLAGHVDIGYRIYKTAFFAAVAHTSLTGMIHKHLQNSFGHQSWNPRYLSLLLAAASDFRAADIGSVDFQDRCLLVRLLLELGADPNCRQHTGFSRSCLNEPCTPWTRALETILCKQESFIEFSQYKDKKDHYATSCKEIAMTMGAFVNFGAKLDNYALIKILPDQGRRPMYEMDSFFYKGEVPSAVHRYIILEVTLAVILDCVLHRLPSDVRLLSWSELSSNATIRVIRPISFGTNYPMLSSFIIESEEDSDYLLEPIWPWFTDEMPNIEEEKDRFLASHPNWYETIKLRLSEVRERSRLFNVKREGLGHYLQTFGYRIPARSHDFKDIPQFLAQCMSQPRLQEC